MQEEGQETKEGQGPVRKEDRKEGKRSREEGGQTERKETKEGKKEGRKGRREEGLEGEKWSSDTNNDGHTEKDSKNREQDQ